MVCDLRAMPRFAATDRGGDLRRVGGPRLRGRDSCRPPIDPFTTRHVSAEVAPAGLGRGLRSGGSASTRQGPPRWPRASHPPSIAASATMTRCRSGSRARAACTSRIAIALHPSRLSKSSAVSRSTHWCRLGVDFRRCRTTHRPDECRRCRLRVQSVSEVRRALGLAGTNQLQPASQLVASRNLDHASGLWCSRWMWARTWCWAYVGKRYPNAISNRSAASMRPSHPAWR